MADRANDAATLRETSRRLVRQAQQVWRRLELDRVLGAVGTPSLTGSAALDLMVWRDIDVTVTCPKLSDRPILDAAHELALHPNVPAMRYRDDRGHWNLDPHTYPDGLFIGLRYQEPRQAEWRADIWFVDQPERQPDLAHLRELPPKLTDDKRLAILRIKRHWSARPEYGRSVRSWDINTAVLQAGIRDLAGFNAWLANRAPDRNRQS
jgi:hypothetical protein